MSKNPNLCSPEASLVIVTTARNVYGVRLVKQRGLISIFDANQSSVAPAHDFFLTPEQWTMLATTTDTHAMVSGLVSTDSDGGGGLRLTCIANHIDGICQGCVALNIRQPTAHASEPSVALWVNKAYFA